MTESIVSRAAHSAVVGTGAEQKSPATVVVVRDDRVVWVRQVVDAIRSVGFTPLLLTTPLTPADRAALEPVVGRIVEVDTVTDPTALVGHLRRIAADVTVVGVMTIPDDSLLPVADAAAHLGLARCPVAGLATARNKHAARVAMRDAGLTVPAFGLIHAEADAAAVARAVGLPAMIKPVNGTASTLVRPVASVDDLAAAYRLIASRLPMTGQYAQPVRLPDGSTLDPRTTFLVEGRLSGREYCVDVIMRDGVAEPLPVVDKALLDDRYFELGFVCPPFDLAAEHVDAIATVAVDGVRALGLDNCVSHVEVIDDATLGPVIVEVNAGRPGGQVLPLLYELTAGVDLFAEAVSLAADAPPPPRKPVTTGVQLATLTIFAEGSGRLDAVHGLDEVAELPEVLNVIPGVSVGDVLSEDVETYAVNLLVGGFIDRDDLRAVYDEAAALVRLDLAPADLSA